MKNPKLQIAADQGSGEVRVYLIDEEASKDHGFVILRILDVGEARRAASALLEAANHASEARVYRRDFA